jgi:hypothetical protein
MSVRVKYEREKRTEREREREFVWFLLFRVLGFISLLFELCWFSG